MWSSHCPGALFSLTSPSLQILWREEQKAQDDGTEILMVDTGCLVSSRKGEWLGSNSGFLVWICLEFCVELRSGTEAWVQTCSYWIFQPVLKTAHCLVRSRENCWARAIKKGHFWVTINLQSPTSELVPSCSQAPIWLCQPKNLLACGTNEKAGSR